MIRNLRTFSECFWPFPCSEDIEHKGNVSEDLTGADVIFTQSFGFERKNSKIVPGLSNEAMARELVWKIFQNYPHPMILQWEVADALPKKPDIFWVIRKHRKEGKYLDSYEVAFQAMEIMNKYGWKKLILVAHPWHMWRKIRIFKKMGIEVIIPPDLKLVPFDKKSEQWWTRNWFLWTVREIPTRLIYKARGWI